ncbi:hypothetical protein HY090_03110 [Candidatus Kaiserbacteria bacterium]|nr:hypothetical protein [Candidatus Kaiserbacteria bacterium]
MQDQSLPQLPSVPVVGAPVVLWFFFAIVFLITVYFVFAELYHWLRWGYMYPLVWLALPVYLIGVVVFLGAMVAGISAA